MLPMKKMLVAIYHIYIDGIIINLITLRKINVISICTAIKTSQSKIMKEAGWEMKKASRINPKRNSTTNAFSFSEDIY